MGMAQAFVNRSLRQFVPLRRPLPTDTHRVARVFEANESLFVRRKRRERKTIRPKTTEPDGTKERSGAETKRRRNEETKETKNENPYTLVSSAANLFATGPTNRHSNSKGSPERGPQRRVGCENSAIF